MEVSVAVRPWGQPFKLNKNTTCGCGCADWSKLSSSKISAFGTSHHHNMRYSPSSSCRVLLNTTALFTPAPCDSVGTMSLWRCLITSSNEPLATADKHRQPKLGKLIFFIKHYFEFILLAVAKKLSINHNVLTEVAGVTFLSDCCN